MTISKVATASFLIATAFSAQAFAGPLGSIGDAVGGLTSGVSNAVDHVAGGGHTGASAAGSAGASTGGVNADVSARTNVAGIAAASLCVGINSTKGCGGATASAAPNAAVASNSAAVQARTTERGGAPSLAVSPDWLLGLMAIGSDGKVLGMIDKVSATRQQQMPTITVQLDKNRKVQLKNAISAINSEGVRLVVPAAAVNNRSTGRMTWLSIQ